MARRRRTDIEIQRVRSTILKAALNLFDKHDYQQLSMRMIATTANCSVATIYNYYPSKDALYMDVLRRGFQLLHQMLAEESIHHPFSIKSLCHRFFDFAVQHQHYYKLMFSNPFTKTPHHCEYEMEKTAPGEREAVIELLNYFTGIIKSCMDKGSIPYSAEPETLAQMLWSFIHGVISLYYSKIIEATGDENDRIFNSIIDSFVSCLEEKNHSPT